MKRALALMLVVASVAAIGNHRRGRDRGAGEEAGHDRSAARAARSSSRSSPSGSRHSGPRTATTSRTRRSARAAASPRSRPRRSTSAPRTRRCRTTRPTACAGCVQIPWALSATSIMYNLPGLNCILRMTGPILAKHLPRRDHELERPGDHEDQPEVHPAEHEDHAGLPLRQLRHDVQLHRLPLGRQPDLEVEARRRRQRAVADRASARGGSSGVSGVLTKTRGRDRLRRRRLRAEEQDPLRLGAERVRQVRDAGPARHPGRRGDAPEEAHGQRGALDRRTRRRAIRSPTRSRRSRT